MSMCILGTGSYLPKKILTNKQLEEIVDTSDEWIVTRTGISERHIDEDKGACGMAVEAAKGALEDAGLTPEDIKLIVVATVTEDRLIPNMACDVMNMLGASCPAFSINAACSGFVYGLHLINGIIDQGPVLLIGVDKLSKVVDWTDRNTCVLFGDGAGAVVLGKGEKGYINSVIRGYPDKLDALTLDGVNTKAENKIIESYINMNGKEVYKFATRVMGEVTKECIDGTNVNLEDIAWFIPHQANVRIIKAAAQKLDVDLSKFYVNIENVGNTSSASCAIALDEMNKKGLLKKGDIISMTAFGGGLTAGSILFEWVK